MGIVELLVVVALGGVVLLALLVGLWFLRRTVTMVKRLVVIGVLVGLVGGISVLCLATYLAYAFSGG